jgi:hypothetical protein
MYALSLGQKGAKRGHAEREHTPSSRAGGRRGSCMSYLLAEMAADSGIPTIAEIRRKVISDLVDLDIVSVRRLSKRARFARRIRRGMRLL